MIPEYKNIHNYTPQFTRLVESTLLELWGRLGEYRKYLVLVGGLAPRFITAPAGRYLPAQALHCGTMDIDLGISLAVTEDEKYKHIHRIMKEAGFQYAKNDDGSRKSHTFDITIDGQTVSVDFLTTSYDGAPDRHVQKVEHELSAIKVKGLGLALHTPLTVQIDGQNLHGDKVTEFISVCRPVAYIILKAISFDNRHVDKDSYDLIYTLLNYGNGVESVAKEILPTDFEAEYFQTAMEMLRRRYASPDHDGPRAYARFIQRPQDAAIAFAAVQQFLRLAEEQYHQLRHT
ncbi:MAG: hypothetical protein J6X49_17230 [Victivallales bacterium]|nr:hypothetical protein [Victivallales bacterium]